MKNSKSNGFPKQLLTKDGVEQDSKSEASNSLCLTVAPCQKVLDNGELGTGLKIVRLTAAENRVLVHVSRAKTNKEVAAALGISPATVKRHLEKIMAKLHLRNRVEVAVYGLWINGCPLKARADGALHDGGTDSDLIADHESLDLNSA